MDGQELNGGLSGATDEDDQELGAFLTCEWSAVVALPVTARAVAAAPTRNGEHARRRASCRAASKRLAIAFDARSGSFRGILELGHDASLPPDAGGNACWRAYSSTGLSPVPRISVASRSTATWRLPLRSTAPSARRIGSSRLRARSGSAVGSG